MSVSKDIKKGYASPRWSGEILDCSMPMTFDQYSCCSYNCLYCFSYFQRNLKVWNPTMVNNLVGYQQEDVASVNVNSIQKLFNLEVENSQFYDYIKSKITMQWGGLSDPFDENERRHGVGLELLNTFNKLNYPICFSTKSVWWVDDERYTRLFKGQRWNVKISIINLDRSCSSLIERECPSPSARLNAIKKLRNIAEGGVTLRLRPFIIGMSDVNDEYLDLIRQAHSFGATAVSTEFFCLESRAYTALLQRYTDMSNALNIDILDFYKKNSGGSGYLRLNWKIKKPYIDKMEALCKKLGMRFYVSDAHHKDRCSNGSCCGLDTSWNYCRGQFTEVLNKAKNSKDGRVYWDRDMAPYLGMFKKFLWRNASSFNTQSQKTRCLRWKQTMYDYIHEIWNSPNNAKSPYKYFYGLLHPVEIDKNKDVVYKYCPYA